MGLPIDCGFHKDLRPYRNEASRKLGAVGGLPWYVSLLGCVALPDTFPHRMTESAVWMVNAHSR